MKENKTENLDEELIDQENETKNLDGELIDQENKTKINLLKENIDKISEKELINQNEEPIKMTSKINVIFDKEDKLNTFSQPTLKNQLFNDFFKNSKKLAKSLFDLQLKWLAFIFFIVFLELFIKTFFIINYSPDPTKEIGMGYFLVGLVNIAVAYPMIFIFFVFNSVSLIQMREENSIKRYFTNGISRIQILFIDIFLISTYALIVELFMLFAGIPLIGAIVNSSFYGIHSFAFDFSQIDWLIFLPSIIFGNILFAVLSFVMGTKINSNKTVQFLGSFILVYAMLITSFGIALVNYPVKEGGGFFVVLFKYLPFINPITIVTEIVSLSGNLFYHSSPNGGQEIYYTLFGLLMAFSIISVVLSAIYNEKLVNLSLGR